MQNINITATCISRPIKAFNQHTNTLCLWNDTQYEVQTHTPNVTWFTKLMRTSNQWTLNTNTLSPLGCLFLFPIAVIMVTRLHVRIIIFKSFSWRYTPTRRWPALQLGALLQLLLNAYVFNWIFSCGMQSGGKSLPRTKPFSRKDPWLTGNRTQTPA